MKSALIRVLRKPEGERERERPAVMYEWRGRRVGGLVRRSAAGGLSIGLRRKVRSESPSPAGQGDSKSYDTRASLTHYQRVWGTNRFDAESLLEEQLMECLECTLLEWGPSPCPTLASRNGCPREYRYLAGRQAPVETVREFMAAVPGPNWANRSRCVLLSAIDHVRNVGAILLKFYLVFEIESEKIYSGNATNTDRSMDIWKNNL